MTPLHPLNVMLDAARAGNWPKVDEMIAAGSVVNERHPDTQTPIIAILASENLPYSSVIGLWSF
jgi:hypothetical protein